MENEQINSQEKKHQNNEKNNDNYKPKHKKRPLVGPIIIILLGVIFLINNMGIDLPWDYIWPLLIIAVGVLLIFNKGFIGGGVITLLVLIVVLAAIFSLLDSDFIKDLGINIDKISAEKMETTTKDLNVKSEKYTDVKEINLDVGIGIGEYTLSTMANEDNLFTSSGTYNYETFEPVLNENFEENILSLDYTTKDVISLFGFSGAISEYDLKLGSPTIKTNFDLNIGTGKAKVELTDQKIGEFDLNIGTGKMTVDIDGVNEEESMTYFDIGTGELYLDGLFNLNSTSIDANIGTGKATLSYDGTPKEEVYNLSLDLGTGSVTIKIPSNIGFKIIPSVRTGKIKVNNETIDDDEDYENDKFSDAETKINFDFDIGTGSVNIEEIEE